MLRAMRFTSAVIILSTFTCGAFAAIENGVLNQIQFEDRENFASSDGILGNIGDRLLGVLTANTINTPNGTQNPVNPEVTGVFDLTIQDFIKISNTTAYMLLRPTNVTGAEGILAGHTAGTAVAFYTGGPANVVTTLNDASKSTADVFAAASDGTFYDDFGFGKVATDGTAAFDDPSDWGAAGNGYWYAIVTGTFAGAVGSSTNTTTSLSPSSTFYYGLLGLTDPLRYVGIGNTDLSPFVPSSTQIEDNREDFGVTPTTLFNLTGKGSTKANTSAAGTTAADQSKFAVFSNDPARLEPLPEPSTIVTWAGIVGVCFGYLGLAKRIG